MLEDFYHRFSTDESKLHACRTTAKVSHGALARFLFWYSNGANNICNSLSVQQSVSAAYFCRFSLLMQTMPGSLWSWCGFRIGSLWCFQNAPPQIFVLHDCDVLLGLCWSVILQASALKAVAGHGVLLPICLFLTLWHTSDRELCLEFIWLKNKLLKVVVTFKSPSLICCSGQFSAHLKKQPKAACGWLGACGRRRCRGRSCFKTRLPAKETLRKLSLRWSGFSSKYMESKAGFS